MLLAEGVHVVCFREKNIWSVWEQKEIWKIIHMGEKSNTAEFTVPFLTTSLFPSKLWLAPEHVLFPCVLEGILLTELKAVAACEALLTLLTL